MSKFLRSIAALSTAIAPFLPAVALALPTVDNVSDSTTIIGYPSDNSGTVIVNPDNRYRNGIVYPGNSSGTVIVNPDNRYRRGVVYPGNNPNTVIVNPVYVNPTYRQPSCGTARIGNPIPSPVPVNPYTGRFCR